MTKNDPAYIEGFLREKFANPLLDTLLCQFSTDNSFSPETLSYKWVQVSNTRNVDPAMDNVVQTAKEYLDRGLLVPDLTASLARHVNARPIKLVEDVRWGMEDVGGKIVMFDVGTNGSPDVVIANDPACDAAVDAIRRRIAAGSAAVGHWPIQIGSTIIEPIIFGEKNIELQAKQVAYIQRPHSDFHA